MYLVVSLAPASALGQANQPEPHHGQFADVVVRSSGPALGDFNVVALRVEFQPDSSRFTTGNGTFAADPYDGLVPLVDPLPHDAQFFDAHLSALVHYVERVSDGKATVNPVLLPGVVRVSGQMQQYSPVGLDASADAELAKLAALVSEGWSIAAAESSVDLSMLDPDRTFFVMYHAGVGRDIELVGTTLEKTPLDLPSIYFGTEKLTQLGISGLRLGGLDIENTAIIPRTETRKGFDFFSDAFFLAELTTNGILAASFFNFLGVPDLFDTSTGESAIGPFGLMDPLGIFAYGGLLPPEPTSWTKLFLGWTEATDVFPDSEMPFSIRAASDPTTSDVVRVWVSSTENFQVENRHRDADDDGLILTIWDRGELKEQRVANGDPLFNSQTIEGFSGGVVVAADDYDWSLPGGLDTDGNPLVGGALIWHVDEQLIRDRLATNSLNANPEIRAIDLEEADSGQDLGHPSPGFFGPQLNLGSPFDFYYLDNPVSAITPSGRTVSLYANRFASDTFPGSHTNGGGPSFASIESFSAPGPVMSAYVRWESVLGVETVTGWPARLAPVGSDEVYFGGGNRGLVTCESNEANFVAGIVNIGAEMTPALIVLRDDGELRTLLSDTVAETAIVCADNRILYLAINDNYELAELDPAGERTRQWQLPVSSSAYTEPDRVVVDGNVALLVFRSDTQTIVTVVDLTTSSVSSHSIPAASDAWGYTGNATVAVAVPGGVDLFGFDGAPVQGGDSGWSFGSADVRITGEPTFGTDGEGLFGAGRTASGALVLLGSDRVVRSIDPVADLGLDPVRGRSPVIADLDADGRLDVLVSTDRHLIGFSQGGAVLSGFPIPVKARVVGQPLVAGTAAGAISILAAASDGYLYAYNLSDRSRVEAGFPVATGGRVESTPNLDVVSGRIYAASTNGSVGAWAVNRYDRSVWPSQYGRDNRGYVQLDDSGNPDTSGRLLVSSETYNWPNPVTEGRTSFRFLATEDCSVRITIVDLAGTVLDEIDVEDVQGGTPAEVTWTTSAQSGLYFARVHGETAAGGADDVLIKVAIIR